MELDLLPCLGVAYAPEEEEVRTGDTLIRETDHKRFRVVDLSHWSTIQADDGETAHVKWIGGDEYVGVNGPDYRLVENAP